MNSLNLEELLELQESKTKAELDTYKSVYKQVESTIRYYARIGHIACFYTVPNYIFGLPLIDIPKNVEYILGILNDKGFIAFQLTYNTIYISWEATKTLKSKKREESKEVKNSIESIKESRDKDLMDVLLRKKK